MAARHASELEMLQFDEAFEGDVRLDEPMARHTTYRIGGPARAFAEVRSVAALRTILEVCKAEGLLWCVVGKGSNLLVSDAGYDGVVLALSGDFRKWRFDEDSCRVTVGAGTMLSRLVQEVFHRGYSGMEFAVGTPGTVGGALCMNAGTKDDWIASRVVSVTILRACDGLVRLSANDITWGYRSSSFSPEEIIVEAELQLKPSLSGAVHEKMNTLLSRRKESQPLNYPSCGSVFRNPEGHSAGALIEGAGLKGAILGGAQISDKHANFIVNKDKATAQDVKGLIALAQDKVKECYGVELQTEVRFLGF